MSSYLLLRSNKQSGPLSREQLLQLGLKPYDLVWIEGKSSAWRYPSEVPELKDYAPIVEEQPYDRFYKKKTEEQKKQEPVTENVKNGHVSVILPKQAVAAKKEEPVFTSTFTPAAAIAERPAEVETKYSESLDEIKERYAKQLQQRKHKTVKKKFIIQTLKKTAVFVAIIGSGVLIGFVIKPKNAVKNNAVNAGLQTISSQTGDVSAKDPVHNTDTSNITATKEQPVTNNEVAANKLVPDPALTRDNKSNLVEKKKADEQTDASSINPATKQTIILTANGERNKNSRTGNDGNESIEKSSGNLSLPATGDISRSVSVKANNYKMRDFGGFRNLELTVTNDSKFRLDNVLVELQYLNIDEHPVKVEHIPFQSIEPGGLLTVRIPDNNRGAKLLYRIIKIESKDSNGKTAGM
jgi:hypothetical protein